MLKLKISCSPLLRDKPLTKLPDAVLHVFHLLPCWLFPTPTKNLNLLLRELLSKHEENVEELRLGRHAVASVSAPALSVIPHSAAV